MSFFAKRAPSFVVCLLRLKWKETCRRSAAAHREAHYRHDSAVRAHAVLCRKERWTLGFPALSCYLDVEYPQHSLIDDDAIVDTDSFCIERGQMVTLLGRVGNVSGYLWSHPRCVQSRCCTQE